MKYEWGRIGMHLGFWWESQKEGLGGRTILKRILEKYDGVVWTGLIWLWIGTSGGLL
jgi:hypothetical protein